MKTLENIQYISQGKTAPEQYDNIAMVLDHGVRWVQLRWKEGTEAGLRDLAEKARALCTKHQATFIINDNVPLAKAVEADGVHLGLEDLSITAARQLLGSDKIIGGTANTLDQLLSRVTDGCDYIGLGPFRFTHTKQKLSPILGLEGYAQVLDGVKRRKINIPPIYAIGGIEADDIAPLSNIGIYGVAVSTFLTQQPDQFITIQSKFI